MSFVDPKVTVVLIVAIAAAICDVRTRRIPNVLTFGAAGLAFIYALATRARPVSASPRPGGWREPRCFFRFSRSAAWAPAT